MVDLEKIVDVYNDYSCCGNKGTIMFVKVVNSDYVFKIINDCGKLAYYTVVKYYDRKENYVYIKEECYFDTLKEAEEYAYGKHKRNDDNIF